MASQVQLGGFAGLAALELATTTRPPAGLPENLSRPRAGQPAVTASDHSGTIGDVTEPEQPEQSEPEDEPPIFVPDGGEHDLTGDALIDRGIRMTFSELKAALKDPNHPDHDAAVAGQTHLMAKFKANLGAAYGERFRRIGENVAASIRPNLGDLFQANEGAGVAAATRPDLAELFHRPPDIPTSLGPTTPQRTLEALVEVSERMSEMVRISAEHRDVAVAQKDTAEAAAAAERKSARRMLWLTLLAVLGTWISIAVAVYATITVPAK